MRIALVHDYIKEYGGAERVLEALCDIYPDAPIYTAFVDKNGTAYPKFKDRNIITSWFNLLPNPGKLASPLRFLTPLVWSGFDLSKYDIVISSASWYVTKGFKKENDHFIEICYCHTPPRWLYGYTTSVNYQKYKIVRIYAQVVGHFLRLYDFKRAQKVDYFIANSHEVAARIKKFYRRDSVVMNPPVSLPKLEKSSFAKASEGQESDYYLIVSRLVGAKGLEIALEAAKKAGFKLKIAGSKAGYYSIDTAKNSSNIEFLGQVTDTELAKLYKGAKGFLALSQDEDFGITPVEAMLSGTPVIAFNGGGYKETVIDGKTGVLFNDPSSVGLIAAIKRFEDLKFDSKELIKHAQKYSRERFEKEIKEFVIKHA